MRELVQLLPLLLMFLAGMSRAEPSCRDFRFGDCDLEPGGILDSFPLTNSPVAIELCQQACQVSGHLVSETVRRQLIKLTTNRKVSKLNSNRWGKCCRLTYFSTTEGTQLLFLIFLCIHFHSGNVNSRTHLFCSDHDCSLT